VGGYPKSRGDGGGSAWIPEESDLARCDTSTDQGGRSLAPNLPAPSEADIAEIARKGGKARAAKLSATELSRIAKLAVASRERKRKEKHNA
jgi:hypothetical protein